MAFGGGSVCDMWCVRNQLLACLVFACAIPACTKQKSDVALAPAVERAPMSRDLQVVDGYLEKWDRFAQGENQLVPELRDSKAGFEAALARLLAAGDKRAPARMVFYPVVEVGGSISAESELGKASATVLGPDFPVTTMKDGQRVYFGGDLYLWWENNRDKYESFDLFDEWSKRDFAQTVVIPMYRRTVKGK